MRRQLRRLCPPVRALLTGLAPAAVGIALVVLCAGVSQPAYATAATSSASGPAASAATKPAAGGNTASVMRVLSQTPWIEGRGVFDIRLGVPTASADRLQVTVFDRLITRTAFDEAANGKVGGYFYQQVVKVSALSLDTSGGVDLPLPVNAPVQGSILPTLYIGETGVFPVQVQLFSASSVPLSAPSNLFLEYASSPGSLSSGYQPLSVALVVPFVSTLGKGDLPGAAPGVSESQRLNRVSAVLDGQRSVPVGVLADPRTLAGLARGAAAGSKLDSSTLSNLAAAVKNGSVSLLPSTYDPSAVAYLDAAGLGSELGAQLKAATAVFKATVGVAPSSHTWVLNGPVGAAALDALTQEGTRNIILPETSLSPLPVADTQTTFARPTSLSDGGRDFTVFGADAGLSAVFAPGQPAVTTANRIVAELAMIETEAPGLRRGVAVVPRAGWSASPQLLKTLIAGLAGNPLIDPVSPSALFSHVPTAPVSLELASRVTPDDPSVRSLAAAAPGILDARQKLDGVTSLLGVSAPALRGLSDDLLTSESASLTTEARSEILLSVDRELAKVSGSFALPPATAITLTSTHGQIPITVLVAGSLHAHVEVKLISQRLLFPVYKPAGGSCKVPTPTEEVCVFALTKQNTTVNVPVEARSSGVFPLEVDLYTPDGSLLLARDRDTVRSTAVSGVAIVLAVLAALSLFVWWGRDLRRGRRRRGLVPSPFDDAEQDPVEPKESETAAGVS